jgi:hypothetical protein
MLGFKTFRGARFLLAGIDVHMIAKEPMKSAQAPRPPLIDSTNWQHKQYLRISITFPREPYHRNLTL